MSFEVRLDTAPRSLYGVLRAALLAFALASAALALGAGEPAQRGWIALACALPFVVVLARRPAPPAAGTLAIDAAGRAFFVEAARPASGALAVRIERWNVFGPFAWLRLRGEGARRPLDVLFVRGGRTRAADVFPAVDGPKNGDATSGDDAWRRLLAWLAWYGRGRAPGASPADAPHPGAPARAGHDVQ